MDPLRFDEDPLDDDEDKRPNLNDFFFVKLVSSPLLLRSCSESVFARADGKREKFLVDDEVVSGFE